MGRREHVIENDTIRYRIDALPLPSQLMELNPIEILWREIKYKIKGHHPSNLKELWKIKQDDGYSISIKNVKYYSTEYQIELVQSFKLKVLQININKYIYFFKCVVNKSFGSRKSRCF